MKWYNKFRHFMFNRYGPDNLYTFLFGLYILIFLLNLFIKTKYLSILQIIIIFIMFSRYFSKNIYKRNKENQKFLKIKSKIVKPFKNIKRNLKDKNYIYKKCKKCKKTLRLPLPYERGIKHVKCPSCKKNITLLVLKKQKIEIIKNSK